MKIFVANTSGLVGRGRHARAFCVLLSIVVMLVINMGCERANGKGAAGGGPPRPQVQVVQVQQRDVPIYKEWIGTRDGFVNADIKAQVAGYLTNQAYTEVSFVR